jgi:hypothetical protein
VEEWRTGCRGRVKKERWIRRVQRGGAEKREERGLMGKSGERGAWSG